MGHDVELASSVSNRTFSEDQEATLSQFVTDNTGTYTYADIATLSRVEHSLLNQYKGKSSQWN